MDTTFLAQFMGILMIIIGGAMLIRRKITLKALDDVFQSRGLLYSIGVAEVVVGLFIILNRSEWDGAVGGVIIFLGWLLLLEGIVYLTASLGFVKKILKWLHRERAYYFLSAVYVVLGFWLTYAGAI